MIATIRASSLSDWLDCPLRAFEKHINGRRTPNSGAAWIGTSLHAGTAAFDAAVLEGSPITVDDAAGVLVDTLHHPEEDMDWGDTSPKAAEPVALTLLGRYCGEIAPRRNYVAVEMTCAPLNIAVDGVTLTLTGTTDRVRRTDEGEAITDLKSGKAAVGTEGRAKTAGHAAQLGAYTLLAETALGQPLTGPAEIIGLNTGTPRVGTGLIADPKAALLGRDGRPGALDVIAGMLKTGLIHGNPRSMTCGAKFCPVYPCSYV